MAFPFLAALPALLEIGKTVIDRVIPDKAAAEKAKQELTAAVADRDFQLQMVQASTNLEEAKNPSLWVSGWRPAIGWVCALSLALIYWPKAVFLTGVWTWQAWAIIAAAADPAHVALPQFPDLGLTDLLGLLLSLLGIGGMRTVEKIRGVARMQ